MPVEKFKTHCEIASPFSLGTLVLLSLPLTQARGRFAFLC
jgi:hypothetical protein